MVSSRLILRSREGFSKLECCLFIQGVFKLEQVSSLTKRREAYKRKESEMGNSKPVPLPVYTGPRQERAILPVVGRTSNFRVLFVYPNSRRESIVPPAITLLSRIAKNLGFQTDVFDSTGYEIAEHGYSDRTREENLTVRPSPHQEVSLGDTAQMHVDLRRKVAEFNPDLIAVTSTEVTFRLAVTILRGISDFEIPVLLGGVFATFAPERALEFPEIDMVCVGEGEILFAELCQRLSRGREVSCLPGLWLRGANSNVIKNGKAPLPDLDQNPTDFDIELFPGWRFYQPMAGELRLTVPIETMRGCPYRCGFCNTPSQHDLYGHDFFRKKNVARVREELLHGMRFNPEYVYFWADTFLAQSPRELDEFCEMYSEFKIPFWIQTRPETITREALRKLQVVGLHRLSVGIEQGDEEYREKVLVRPYSNQLAIERLEIASALDIPFSTFNMIGLPDETPALHWQTVLLNRQIRSDTTNCSTFTPFVGTSLRELAVRRGYLDPKVICSGTYEESLLHMPQFPRDRIRALQRVFPMYVKFPKERWPEIREAEALTDEGDAVWRRLREEFTAAFFEAEGQPAPHG